MKCQQVKSSGYQALTDLCPVALSLVKVKTYKQKDRSIRLFYMTVLMGVRPDGCVLFITKDFENQRCWETTIST